jgi:RNA polymerase sigma-70 factor (ECF subfamily)
MQQTWPFSRYQVAATQDADSASGDPVDAWSSPERAKTVSWSLENAKQLVVNLYDTLRPQLYRYLINRGVAPQDVEEIVQESFLRLFQHVSRGGNEENLRAWLYKVSHNLAENMRKSRYRLVDEAPDSLDQWAASALDHTAGPEEQLLEREQSLLLHTKLSKLTQLQRDCLNLRVEGFRYREIGGILNVGTSTVAGSLRNAIAKLVKELV